MVRRLVEHEKVRRVEHHPREHEARLLAAGEHAAALLDVVAAEAEGPEERAQRRDGRLRVGALEGLEHGARRVEHLHGVLREVPGLHARADGDGARVGPRLARHELEQSALARAVDAHDAPPLAAADEQVEAVVDDPGAVALRDALELRHVVAGSRGLGEIELDDAAAARGLDLLDLVELLHPRLHLRGVARAGLEAVDEGLLLGEHRLLPRVLGLVLRLGEGALAYVRLVVAGVGHELAAIEVDDARDEAVHELAVVRGHEHRALELAEPALEPDDALDVEVVRRLVEQERVGALQQDLRERDAHLPAAGEVADVAVDEVRREAEAREDLPRPRLERVAVEGVEARLHLAEALDQGLELVEALGVGHAVLEQVELVGHVGDLAGARHRLLDDGAAVHVAHALLEPPEGHAAVDDHGAGVGRIVAGDHAEDGALARAVGAHQADLLALEEAERGVDEEDLLAVLTGDGVESDHREGRAP